ncbi:hypothetical protein NBRC116493_10610 [Aurantivibrio infirmus]
MTATVDAVIECASFQDNRHTLPTNNTKASMETICPAVSISMPNKLSEAIAMERPGGQTVCGAGIVPVV